MKRDCGVGELVPIRYEVVSCSGTSDDEQVLNFKDLKMALSAYEIKITALQNVKCSDVRLYAIDKQRYANCVASWIRCANGEINTTNRLAELS